MVEFRTTIHAAHAILFSPPEYAGALPGPFVNLLDWTIGDDQPGSIYEKPVGWVNASVRGASKAVESLRRILSFAHATVIEAACIEVPLTAAAVGTDGLVADRAVRSKLVTGLSALGSAVMP